MNILRIGNRNAHIEAPSGELHTLCGQKENDLRITLKSGAPLDTPVSCRICDRLRPTYLDDDDNWHPYKRVAYYATGTWFVLDGIPNEVFLVQSHGNVALRYRACTRQFRGTIPLHFPDTSGAPPVKIVKTPY